MKITKIEKKKRLYQLELDAKENLYVTEDTIVRFMLSKDKVIDEAELTEIKQFAQFSYGKNLALFYLSFKRRTSQEVKDYLIEKEIDYKIVKEIIQNLTEDRWIDDRQYIRSSIEANLYTSDKGPYVLKQKLMKKGLDANMIEEELATFDFWPLCQKISEKLLRKYEGKLPERALKDKIIQSLSMKGFSYRQAKEALDVLDLDLSPQGTQDLLEKELEKVYKKYARKYEGYELKQRLTQTLMRKGFDYSDIQSALRDFL